MTKTDAKPMTNESAQMTTIKVSIGSAFINGSCSGLMSEVRVAHRMDGVPEMGPVARKNGSFCPIRFDPVIATLHPQVTLYHHLIGSVYTPPIDRFRRQRRRPTERSFSHSNVKPIAKVTLF
jgi:hypothetical protein